MKKVLLVAFFLALAFTGAQGQLSQAFSVTGNATPAGAQASLVVAGNQAGLYTLTFIPTGTVSTCTVKIQDSSDNSSFTDRGTVQTCTASGQYNLYVTPTSYVRVNITAQTGTGSVLYNLNATPNTPVIPKPQLGNYQGTTAVSITTTSFTALIAAASDIAIPGNTIVQAGQRLRIHAAGVYTNAAASLLNAEVMLCTVSGCGSGTVVAPAGCAVVTTNQANNLTNGQWTLDCELTSTSTLGASGTFMAKSIVSANLGSATTAVQSPFADTVVAVSAAVDETVTEFVNIAFKFSTSNAGNLATVNSASVDLVR